MAPKKAGKPKKFKTMNWRLRNEMAEEMKEKCEELEKETALCQDAIVKKVPLGMEHEFEMEGPYIEYMSSGIQQRRQLLKKMCRIVTYRTTETQRYIAVCAAFYGKLKDPKWAGFRWGLAPEEEWRISIRYWAQKTFLNRHDNITQQLIDESSTRNKQLKNPEEFDDTYWAPATRILVTANLTFNKFDRLPVYTNIPDETLENIDIPKRITFEYTDCNVVDALKEPEMAKCVQLVNEFEQNQIYCNCEEEGFVNCFENPKCLCYEVNEKMRDDFQVQKEGEKPTDFHTFKPILFNHVHDSMWNYVGFACSDLCKCKGKCTNNVLYISQQKLFPLELFRIHPLIGFNLRSPVMIPGGVALMEFTGDLCTHDNVIDIEYAFNVPTADDVKFPHFIHQFSGRFTKEYMELLEHFVDEQYYIDPTIHGNVGRMCGHSCTPNIELVKVFTKSLSPAHVKFMMVTLVDVYPGTPLTIDYGLRYVQRLKGRCGCKTIGCHNNPKAKTWYKETSFNLAGALQEIQALKNERFVNEIMTPAYGIFQRKEAEEAERLRLSNPGPSGSRAPSPDEQSIFGSKKRRGPMVPIDTPPRPSTSGSEPSTSGPSTSGPSARSSAPGPSGSGSEPSMSTSGPSTSDPFTSRPSARSSAPGPSGLGSGSSTSTSRPSTSGPSTSRPSMPGPSTSGPSTSRTNTSRSSMSGPSTSRPSMSGPSTSRPSTSTQGSSNRKPGPSDVRPLSWRSMTLAAQAEANSARSGSNTSGSSTSSTRRSAR